MAHTDTNFLFISSQSTNYDKCFSILNAVASQQTSTNHDIKFRIYKSNKYQTHNARLNVLAIISYLYEYLYVMTNSKYLAFVFAVIIQNDALKPFKLIYKRIKVQRENFIS